MIVYHYLLVRTLSEAKSVMDSGIPSVHPHVSFFSEQLPANLATHTFKRSLYLFRGYPVDLKRII